jgi:hypothetical protein
MDAELKITIALGNAAFGEEPGLEVARILRKLADRAENYFDSGFGGRLLDVNGNKVGTAEVSE